MEPLEQRGAAAAPAPESQTNPPPASAAGGGLPTCATSAVLCLQQRDKCWGRGQTAIRGAAHAQYFHTEVFQGKTKAAFVAEAAFSSAPSL